MNKKHQFNVGYAVIAVLLLVAFETWLGFRQIAQISYSEFQTYLDNKQIAEVTVTPTQIQGKFTTPQDGKTISSRPGSTPISPPIFKKAGVKVSGGSDSNWLTTLFRGSFRWRSFSASGSSCSAATPNGRALAG